MAFDKKKNINFLEFMLILIFFVIPPIINFKQNKQISLPKDWYNISLFLFYLLFLASFEELLYRVYLPFRIKTFNFNKGYVNFFTSEVLPLIFFAFAHLYLGWLNVLYAFFMGSFFRFIYVKLKNKFSNLVSFSLISGIHFFHNFIVVFLFK